MSIALVVVHNYGIYEVKKHQDTQDVQNKQNSFLLVQKLLHVDALKEKSGLAHIAQWLSA